MSARIQWKELIDEIWLGVNPLSFSNRKYIDKGYPHTNINEAIVTAILTFARPVLWVECGSMIGGSAIKTASIVKSMSLDTTTVVCIDPFIGDVNMIAWEKQLHTDNSWCFNRVEEGKSTIYERFRANVMEAGHEDVIVPIQATSVVGMKLLQRLFTENRLSRLPDVVYLDSAHELSETYLELHKAWNVLRSKGVMFGDDWDWEDVRHDVTLFASNFGSEIDTLALRTLLPGSELTNESVLLFNGHWFIIKK